MAVSSVPNLGTEMFGFETHEQSVFCSTDCLGEMCDEWFNKLCIG